MLKQINNTLNRLPLWKLCTLTLLLGGVTTMALPPFSLLPGLLGLPALILVLDTVCDRPRPGWHGFWVCWWFGFGYFTFGLYWIANALTVDIAKFWWVFPFSIFGLPFILSFFTALPGLVLGLLRWRGLVLGLGFSVFWVLAEWLRAFVLTGFPWNFIGYAWCFSDEMIQVTSLTGIYGLSLLTLLLATAFLGLLRHRLFALGMLSLAIGIYGFGAFRLSAPTDYHEGVWLRLVQPSIHQTVKWNPQEKENNFQTLLQLSRMPSKKPLKAVIWPETAVPFFLEQEGFRRELIQTVVPKEGFVITGAPRRTSYEVKPVQVWNSIVAVNDEGEIPLFYDKSHLVPFGEYFPLRSWFEPYFEVRKITAGSLDFSSGPGPQILKLEGLPTFGGLVCYESIFPGHVVCKAEERPQWLLNVTNDGWYGDSPGPYQHLQISRVRAVEEGIPLVRSANTGISAVYDAYGRELGRIGLMVVGLHDFQLPKPLNHITLYGKYGNLIILLLLALGLISLVILNRRGSYERFYLYQ